MKIFTKYNKIIILFMINMLMFFTGCSGIKQVSPNYDVGLTAKNETITLESSVQEIELELKIYNKTFYELSSDRNIYLSYHILDKDKNMIQQDGIRTKIVPIPPRGRGKQNIKILTPKEPGEYILQLDLVEEGVAWFSDKGNPTIEVGLKVEK